MRPNFRARVLLPPHRRKCWIRTNPFRLYCRLLAIRATSRLTSPPPTGPLLATYPLGSFQDWLSIVVARVGFEPTRSFEQ